MTPGTSAAKTTNRAVALAVEHQKMSEWCWAAVSVSVNRLFRPESTHTQCEIAGTTLGHACCAGSAPAACNSPHELHPVLGTLHLLAQDPIVRPIPFDHVQKEIDAGHPVCILIRWLNSDGTQNGRGHFITIRGYRVTPAQNQFVSIADPLYGSSEIAYAEFANPKGGYRDGNGLWFATFLVANEAAS